MTRNIKTMIEILAQYAQHHEFFWQGGDFGTQLFGKVVDFSSVKKSTDRLGNIP